MNRLFLLLLLALIPASASAARLNCTVACTFVTDAYPSMAPMPTTCKLYSAGALKTTAPVEAVTGGVRCKFVVGFPTGSYSLTASAVDAAGVESAQSAPPFVFDSAVPMPAPANLRIAP